MRLKHQVALVTGASSGIGRAIALRLAQEGADVAINYRHNATGARAVVEAIEAMGRQALMIEADVAATSDVDAMIAAVLDRWERIDVLVNNAGVVRRGGLFEITEAIWDEVVDVNLKGVFLCAQAAARAMQARQRGTIVNISSMRGVEGGATSMHYAAAKAGVIALTKSLARELAPHIRVNGVAPGYVDTRIQSELSAEKRRAIEASTPLARFGEPEDVAGAVAFLASHDAAFMTGQTLLVDGGRVMC